MDTDEVEKETLLFLDFKDKLPSELLENEVFIRLANLEEKHPLVQVNDLVFKGTYTYSIGTNLFFKKVPNQSPCEFPFKEPSRFNLHYLTSQTKVLSCQQMKIPSATAQLPENQEYIRFNFNWDYKELLKKFENGTLDLQDMVVQNDFHDDKTVEELPQTSELVNEEDSEEIESEPDHSMEISDNIEVTASTTDISEIEGLKEVVDEQSDELVEAYKHLQLLARTPLKRELVQEDCSCDPQFKPEYEYKSIESKILEPPLFSYVKNPTDNKLFENHINLESCITLGLLSPSNTRPRILSDDEKRRIMTVENFENLDLTARYSVLLSHMEQLEKQIESNSLEQNQKKDEFDRSPVETLQILKRLLLALEQRLSTTRKN